MAWEKLGSTTVGGSSDPVNNSWKEIGRTTLSGTADDITVSSLPAKDNIMVLGHIIQSGVLNNIMRLGYGSVDTGSNYAGRYSENGAADGTDASATYMVDDRSAEANDQFWVSNIANIANQEKLANTDICKRGTVGSGNIPERVENVGKWTNTSNVLDTFSLHNSGGGDMASGSEIVILGCDNDEADLGTNFWQELSSTVLTATHSGTLTIPQFTTKKYLMIRYYINSTTDCFWKVGTGGSIDSGANQYGNRYSSNGAGDSTLSYTSFLSHNPIVEGEVFIINKSDQEKLIIQHEVGQNQGSGAGGSGAGNIPNRREGIGKWANTSGQIDTLQFEKSGISFYAGTNIKVYGAD